MIRNSELFKKSVHYARCSLATLLIGIMSSPAYALLPSPREGECDPAVFTPFPDFNIGPGTLKGAKIPEDPKLMKEFIKDRKAAIELGKAFFWDMQIGTDGIQACGTCHFVAGADSRSKNQLSPGGANDKTGVIDVGGANNQLTPDMFPLLSFADRTDRHSAILRQTDDVVSSAGIHPRNYQNVKRGASQDVSASRPDATYNVGGINVRRVEPRNTPTMINAAFNNKNFWDGRANNIFNGVSEFGAGDQNARVLKAKGGHLVPVKVRLDFSSLASQAVGPIVSNLEMSAFNRTRREIGRRVTSAQPLAKQRVHPQDSVLGHLATKTAGLDVKDYAHMIRKAFYPQWWNSSAIIRVNANGKETYVNGKKAPKKLADNEYTQMENNFSLFFGLAVQEYEKTLISDDAKIDRHYDNLAVGRPGLLNEQELRGQAVFQAAACAACHSGPEFTNASIRVSRTGFDNPNVVPVRQPPEQVERMFNGNCEVVVYEQGFYNLGIRPTAEDLGAGAKDPFGNPLSAADILTANPNDVPSKELLTFTYPNIANPPIGPGTDRTVMAGAFKIPGLRNVELTAPYYHNGGQLTLRQVVEFYNRGGDFHELNDANMDFEIGKLGLTEQEMDDLVAFLLTLTDDRVRNQQAPFDRPELFVPVGSIGNNASVFSSDGVQADDDLLRLPEVGRNGGPLPPTFLQF